MNGDHHMPATTNREQRRKRERAKPKGAVIRITVADKTYTLDVESAMNELTGRDAAQVRRATGMSLRALFQAAKDDPDLDTISALVFLARRQDDPRVTFDEVIDDIGYRTEIEFDESDIVEARAIEGSAKAVEDNDPET
jgi:hypothetical protein